jgi:hypothetical protein
MTITKEEIQAMSVDDKCALLDMLWKSLKEEGYVDNEEEETEEEFQLLCEKIEEFKVHPAIGIR